MSLTDAQLQEWLTLVRSSASPRARQYEADNPDGADLRYLRGFNSGLDHACAMLLKVTGRPIDPTTSYLPNLATLEKPDDTVCDGAITQWSAPRDLGSWVPDPTAGCAEFRLVLCPTCGSEGVLIRARGNDPDHESYEECPECQGARDVLIEVEPIELDDLPPPQGETP